MPVLVDGELVLYGFVGEDFFDEGFTAVQVLDALAMLGRDADVTVRLNSGGGYTDDGIAIFNALKAHRGTVSIVVDAIAASAASVIAMAGDDISMRAGSLMMIHDPMGFTFGNAGEHDKSSEQLNKLADLMADIYAERTGEDPDDIREEMRDELWLTGSEAVERGFATETEGGRAKAVAAFDYRLYAQAPQKLIAKAQKEKWSFEVEAHKAAAVAQPKPQTEDTSMGKPAAASTVPATSEAPDAGQTTADVKDRIKAILACDEAKAFPTLAQTLAFDTDVPPESAIAQLKAAAADAPTDSTDGDPPADPEGYQARRSAAADLAQPTPPEPKNSKAKINLAGIYAARRKGA